MNLKKIKFSNKLPWRTRKRRKIQAQSWHYREQDTNEKKTTINEKTSKIKSWVFEKIKKLTTVNQTNPDKKRKGKNKQND